MGTANSPDAKALWRIVWRQMAKADLEDIIDYIAKDNPIRADEFRQELQGKALVLAQHPNLGHSGRPGLPAFVRELVVHRHYILFYRLLAATRTVEILRVRHTAQQAP